MHRIVPFLWFHNHTEEAVRLYTTTFENTSIDIHTTIPDGPAKGNATATFTLEGHPFSAFDASGPFQFTPAVSFFVNCASVDEVERIWNALIDGGMALMPLDNYGFSERFGWLEDRFGVSWQLNAGARPQKIAPFLMFVGDHKGQAEEAMGLYTSLFPDSHIGDIHRHTGQGPDPEGAVMHAIFTLQGHEFMASDSYADHAFSFSPATSLYVPCDTQDEIDRLWDKLGDGGQYQQCGWLTDRFGVSWQIAPKLLDKLLYETDDPEIPKRATQVMLNMTKWDIKTLEQACNVG